MTTRTCKRCSGRGVVDSGVVHLGAPGRCYGCDGTGVQCWAPADAVRAEKQTALDKHIAEVRGEIVIVSSILSDESCDRLTKKRTQVELTQKTELLAELLDRSVSAGRGEWRPAPRQKVGV
jgi:hypothetical protein